MDRKCKNSLLRVALGALGPLVCFVDLFPGVVGGGFLCCDFGLAGVAGRLLAAVKRSCRLTHGDGCRESRRIGMDRAGAAETVAAAPASLVSDGGVKKRRDGGVSHGRPSNR